MPRKILVVEDNSVNRKLLHRMLSREYDIIEAENGEEALKILQEKYKLISALILDILMPVMDGFEVLKRMRSNPLFSQIPVIVATGFDDKSAEVKAISLGANDFITKPYHPSLLLHCLKNVINLRETASIVNAIQRDKLTGLLNREAFFEKASLMLKNEKPGFYIMSCFDIDNFKIINDQFGASEGDRILRHIGKVTSSDIESVGGIASRISADNFAVLYPAAQTQIDFITKMRKERLIPENSRIAIVFSVGRYIVTDPSLSASTIYDRAYIAKQSIKGRYDVHVAYFDESMREKLILEQQIISEMSYALATNQFEVWFQPQFNHSTGALIGAEALVRWRHPQKGLIPPIQFIPVFEQNGFVYELDKYVWEQACRYLRKWIDEERNPMPVSVNISRYDVFRPDLIDVITGLVKKYDLPTDLLRLEITESAFAKSTEQIIDVVTRLMNLGFLLEIDDFGSGYSSLNTLKDVPADVLKLDMRFLEGDDNSRRGGNILESIVRMAKWLDMAVIAEGVETAQQADYLQSIGCSHIQGYLYAKPMPAHEYEALTKEFGKEKQLLKLETVENLDNNSFWDPTSMDTLIFNSYVGGACIYEYHNGNIEMIRANSKYAQVIGSDSMTIEDALKLSWTDHLDESNYAALISALEESTKSNDEVSKEFIFLNLPGCPEKTYLRSTMRVIASYGNHYLVYCTNENITAQRIAEQEEKNAVQTLRKTDEQLRFLNEAAHDLLAQPDANIGIEHTLKKLLNYFDGKRAYVFEFNNEQRLTSNTYEVCAPDVVSEIDFLQNIPVDTMPFWLHAFDRNEYISIEDVDLLDDTRLLEKQMLQAQDIKSLVAVPIMRDQQLIGFIGIDDPAHFHTQISRLSAIGDYIAVMLTRRDLNAKINNDHNSLLKLMNDTPGGFVRMQILPDSSIIPLYMNSGFCDLVDMSLDEAMNLYSKDSLAGVHPDDIVIVRDAVNKMLAEGEARSLRYRLLHGSRGYTWVMIFGRMTKDEHGQTFLNIYYTDMSKQKEQEEQQIELLDNMPCGAALYEFDGDTLKAVHLNKRYQELVGRIIPNPSYASVLGSIHPDDTAPLIAELIDAIRENRDFERDIRILIGATEEYRSFHASGRIIEKSPGKYAIYASFTPNASEETLLLKMIPAALGTLMKSSPEICFVKDRDQRIICASHAFAEFSGYDDERELIGKTDYELVGKKYADRYSIQEKAVIEKGEPQQDYDEAVPLKDHTFRYVTTSKYPVMDSAGNIIGLYGVLRDTTEYHNTFEQLRLLTDSIPGGIASFEITANSIRLTYFNEGFYSWSGYQREEFTALCSKDPFFLILPEDLHEVHKFVSAFLENNVTISNCTYRSLAKDGSYRWFSLKGMLSHAGNNKCTVNAVQFDITEQRETEARLRMSEEQFRIAASQGERTVARYNIKTSTYYNDSDLLFELGFGREIHNVPQAFIDSGLVSPDCIDDFLAFYDEIRRGAKNATTTVFLLVTDGSFRWFRLNATNVFDINGNPSDAILVFYDVTDQREKETVYLKWQQSLLDRPSDTYTLFRCNLSKNTSYDSVEGSLLKIIFGTGISTFNMRTMEYAELFVYHEDRSAYINLLNSDTLLAGYYRGIRTHALEYREIISPSDIRWLKVSVELVEYPDSSDIEAYLMYEDINSSKLAYLETKELAERDPLTGVLNRNAFSKAASFLLSVMKPDSLAAFMLLDIDEFKQINDQFGHIAGDNALIEMTKVIRSVIRHGDLVGRLGGDEFLLYLNDIADISDIAHKASRICDLVYESFNDSIKLSVSIGISVYPYDGLDFDTLYNKSDIALYQVKEFGKNHYTFYSETDDSVNTDAADSDSDYTGGRNEKEPVDRR